MTGILQRRKAAARAKPKPRHVDVAAYYRAKLAVVPLARSKGRSGDPVFISRQIDEHLRRAGYVVLAANEPPPGWTVESDRIEENVALGEITANRKAL